MDSYIEPKHGIKIFYIARRDNSEDADRSVFATQRFINQKMQQLAAQGIENISVTTVPVEDDFFIALLTVLW